MTNQILDKNRPWFLQAADFFSDINNVDKKWQNSWTYPQIEQLLKELVRNLNPEFAEASFDQIVIFLNSYFQEKSLLESVVPQNLKQLLEEYEENKEKAAFLRQQEAEKVQAWLEAKQKQRKNDEFFNALRTSSIKKLSQSPLTPAETKEFADSVVPQFEEIEIPQETKLAVEKVASLPESPEKVIENAKIEAQLKYVWEQAVERTIQELGSRGIELNEEQVGYLKKNVPNEATLLSFSEEITNRPAIVATISESLTPVLSVTQATVLVDTIQENLITSLPVVDLDREKFDGLPPEEQIQINGDLKTKFEEAAVEAIAINYPDIASKLTVDPKDMSRIVAGFAPQTVDEVKTVLPVLKVDQVTRENILSFRGNELPTITEPVNATPASVQSPSLFASPRKQAIAADPKQLVTDGVTEAAKTRNLLFRTGINAENTTKITSERTSRQAFELAITGVTPDDINKTIDELKKRGVEPNSLAIRELETAKVRLQNFERESKITGSQIDEWRAEGNRDRRRKGLSLRLPGSRSRVQIIKQQSFVSSRWNQFTRRIFGERAIVNGNQIGIISKFTYFRQNITTGIKNWFFKTGVGKSIKAGLQKTGAKALQGLWNTAKTGSKQIIVKGITTIATKFGLQGVLSAIGAALGPLGIVAGAAVGFLLKKGIKTVLAGFTLAPKFVSSLGNAILGITQTDFDKKDGQLLVYVVAGVLIVIAFFALLVSGPIGGAFMGSGVGSALPGGIEIDPNCTGNRPLAEETICKLSREKDPCNNSFITINTWPQVNSCFSKITLTGGDSIKNYFFNSINIPGSNGNLQCGSFAMAIQAALGKPLIPVNFSREWLNPINVPSYYELIKTGNPKLNPGDLVVWQGSTDGHVAIVINNLDQEGKVVVAEANGQTGKIALVAYPYSSLGGQDGSPDGLLRPK